MATLNTAEYTAQTSLKRVTGSKVTSSLRIARAQYVCTAADATGDVIKIIELPVGAIVLPRLCTISTDGTGATTAAITKLGDGVVDNRYSGTSVSVQAAATAAVTPIAGIDAAPFVVTNATAAIQATLSVSSGLNTAGKVITFYIAYLMPE